ncbi:hypothetical protein JMJ35_006964 [Cladonia borealis]|uniref:Uncharacterized protein n=1 Tax=Cladonia borealis TaxID=184061 RepID=A0AA39QWH6_9LECA|nr:hypothetical protein JMJ35_006964 [Cladonia borealis]
MSYQTGGNKGGLSKNKGKGTSPKVEGGSGSQNRGTCIRLVHHTKQSYPANISQGPTSSSGISPNIPENLSFYVRIEPLSPDYGVHGQQIRHSEPGDWLPPNRPNGLRDGQGHVSFLRWAGGRITTVPPNDQIRTTSLDGYVYTAATVFTQFPDIQRLLAVPFNARTRSVYATYGRGWQAIRFNHNRVGDSNTYLSYISHRGAERAIAAPGSPRWMPELLPVSYDCDHRHASRNQGGLIGELPLLFALAAFSIEPNQGFPVNAMGPGRWYNHGQTTGRIAERGMVVTIYTDPRNPHWSTPQLLDRLQNGEFGPFYG